MQTTGPLQSKFGRRAKQGGKPLDDCDHKLDHKRLMEAAGMDWPYDGKRYTSFHRTNKSPNERVMIYELLFEDGDWKLGAKVGE